MALPPPSPAAPSPLAAGLAAFAAHLRDPAAHPCPPGLPPERLAVYRELFYNGVEGLLAGGFPVLRRVLGDAPWHVLVAEFYARHRCRTPLFPAVGREFLDYLEQERGPRPGDPPWLAELAHYEWVELDLAIDPREVPSAGIDPEGDLLAGRPVVSPLVWLLHYAYPVQRIGPDLPDPAPAPTHLAVWRGRDDRVGFLELAPAVARLLEWVSDDPAPTGREALAALTAELGHPEPDRMAAAGAAALARLRDKGLILGTALPADEAPAG